MIEKFKSRKFLMALGAQIVGLIVLFYPEHQGEIESAATNVTSLIFMALVAIGWIKAEGVVDANREAQTGALKQAELHAVQQEKDREERTAMRQTPTGGNGWMRGSGRQVGDAARRVV